MNLSKRFLAAAAGLVLAASALAQKAEPLRIDLKQGSSGTAEGKLRGNQQLEYVVEVKGSRKLAFRLEAEPPGTLALELRDPAGNHIALKSAGKQGMVAQSHDSGDYYVSVQRVAETRGSSAFTLTVTIK